MTQQVINVGATANDGTGDPLRVAGQKVNSNFTEVYAIAQAAYNQANTATYPDQASFDTANSAFDQANTATTIAQAGYDQANTGSTIAQSGYDQANTANTTAQSGFDQANTANTLAQTAFDSANSANTVAQSGYDQANTANTTAQSGFDQANTANTVAQSGFDQANTANTTAQSAYDTANNALANTTGTFAGDLTVTGNVSLSSNLIFSDSTIQTTAATPYKNVITISTSGNSYLTTLNEIVMCDPNAAGADINVLLPFPTANGQVVTVKNINTGANVVYIQPGDAGDPMELLSGTIGTGVYETLAASGNTVTWVWDSSCWRIISSY